MKKVFVLIATLVTAGFITACSLCVSVLRATQTVSAFEDGGLTVVVDAGHGGIDGGVSGRKSGVKESDLNLAIAYCLKTELEDIGFEVVLTRKTEGGLYGTPTKGFKKRDMQRRKEISQGANADFLISVHQNYYSSKAVRGGQVFYGKANPFGESFAQCVQGKLNALYAEKGVSARKITAGEFFMLECAPCPSLIVECGFLSNTQDEELLLTESWKGKLAKAIASGLTEYLSSYSG